MYRIAQLTEKKFWKRSAIKAQQILKTLIRNATYAIFQKKKKKRTQLPQLRRLRKFRFAFRIVLCPPLHKSH